MAYTEGCTSVQKEAKPTIAQALHALHVVLTEIEDTLSGTPPVKPVCDIGQAAPPTSIEGTLDGLLDGIAKGTATLRATRERLSSVMKRLR